MQGARSSSVARPESMDSKKSPHGGFLLHGMILHNPQAEDFCATSRATRKAEAAAVRQAMALQVR